MLAAELYPTSPAGGPPAVHAALGINAEGPWLAAYTRPRHEFQAHAYWNSLGLEVFLPAYRSWRRWSDRRKLLEIPLFPSYVFLRLRGEQQRLRALQAPGFLWFVHNRMGPVRVEDSELSAIRRLLASGLEFDPMPFTEIGDEVEVTSGALRGCRGIVERKQPNGIILQIAAIQGAVRVQLPDSSWLCKIGGASPRALARGAS